MGFWSRGRVRGGGVVEEMVDFVVFVAIGGRVKYFFWLTLRMRRLADSTPAIA